MSAPTCTYCHTNPGTKPTGVWQGFKDCDTGEFVCWDCQHDHYKIKHAKPEFEGLYSELPVMINKPQLNLHL